MVVMYMSILNLLRLRLSAEHHLLCVLCLQAFQEGFDCHNMQRALHKTDRNKGSENVFHTTRDVGMVKTYPICLEAGKY